MEIEKKRLPRSEAVQSIIEASLNAVAPGKLMTKVIRAGESTIQARTKKIRVGPYAKLITICVGKAAVGMQQGLETVFQSKITAGLVITKNIPDGTPNIEAEVIYGEHPVPGLKSLEAGQILLKKVEGLRKEDTVIIGISGGASSLLIAPVPGLTLADIKKTNELLLKSGLPIQDINCIRKHLDTLKGGGLARMLFPARVVTLILSDVFDDSISNIGSGLTAEDPSTFKDAVEILNQYGLMKEIPALVEKYLSDGALGLNPETVKRNDIYLTRVTNLIIGSNQQAIRGAEKAALSLGILPIAIKKPFFGNAAENGPKFARLLIDRKRRISSSRQKPFVIIAGGESTVYVQGAGKGGRNLEMALSAVEMLDGIPDVSMVCLASDGEDGVTDAAGAIVDGSTARQAKRLGLDSRDFLARNDSYSYFSKTGGLIRTGPTGTNVNDLVFLFSW